jgi:hypothetical protein
MLALTHNPAARLRRLGPAALLVVGAARTSDSEDSSGDNTPPASDVAPTEAGFQVPGERLEEIEAAGLEATEVDYPRQPEGVPWPTGGP